MKKGEVELKVASGSCGMNDYFIEQINGNPFTIFNLKDLRDLITEELEEEASNHTATCTALQENGMVNDFCCQPLTEREGECSCYKMNWHQDKNTDCGCPHHRQPQQESKEEECCHGCSTGKGCEKSEEPSKKPSIPMGLKNELVHDGFADTMVINSVVRKVNEILEYLEKINQGKI